MQIVHWMSPNVFGFWGGVTVIIAVVVVTDLFLVTAPAGAMNGPRRVLAEATGALV